MFVEVIDDHTRHRVAFEFDDQAGILVGLIADSGNVGEDFFIHQRGNSLHQCRAVDPVGDFGDDDALLAAFDFFEANGATHFHAAASGGEIIFDALESRDRTPRRKVRAFDDFIELFDLDLGIIDLGANAVDDLAKIVRGQIRGHADGDSDSAIDEEIRECRGQDSGLGLCLVVIRLEIHRVLVEVLHHHRAEMGHARLGVTHRRGRVALDGAEIPLPIHEHLAHAPRLRHVNQCRINRAVTVRMVVTHRFTDDFRALEMFAVGLEPELAHGVENAALGGLESVAHIRQGAGHNHRHRIIQKGLFDLVGDIDRFDPFIPCKEGFFSHNNFSFSVV